jgi:glc operon protein GlcG
MKQTYTISHHDAMKIITAIQAKLDSESKGATVAVADEHGELVALLRTDGCPLASINNAINKAFTAARERKESREVGASSRDDKWPLTNFGDLRYIGWGGGVPIFFEGHVIGAVGVSGLPEEEDIALAKFGVQALG